MGNSSPATTERINQLLGQMRALLDMRQQIEARLTEVERDLLLIMPPDTPLLTWKSRQ